MEQAENKKGPFIKDPLIEDWLDLNFYHPLGYKFAILFNKLGFSPNLVSFISMIFGLIGAFMVYYSMPVLGVLFIVFAGVLDSSDGQLARMSGKTSVYGRIIDGLVGYVIFGSIYILIGLKYKSFIAMILAGVSNGIHSSVYDFYRTAYLAVTRNRFLDFFPPEGKKNLFSKIYSFYMSYQTGICKHHISFIKKLITEGKVLNDEKLNFYKKKMISNIQYINILGDNWKINGLLFLAVINRLDLFFYYIIFIINLVFVLVVLRQRKIDLTISEAV